MPEETTGFRYIVRIVNTDVDGNKKILSSLRKIKGVGFMFANAICSTANINQSKKTGYLSDDEVRRIDEVTKNPLKFNIPVWMLNRRKDYETGKDMHVLTTDLNFAKDSDIKRLKKIKCYRGIRHAAGLPVRGQRTKSNFRKNKGNVMGVKKKADIAIATQKSDKKEKKS